MDLAQVLHELWQRRNWLVLGALIALFAGLSTGYHVGLLPPKVEKKSLAIGTANTQILIDTPQSSLTDLGIGLEPLAERASVFARFMTSRPVRASIAQEVGLKEDELVTEAPQSEAVDPNRAERSDALLGEDTSYRISFATDRGLPTITIRAQAPRAEDAIRLADAGAAGFARYVKAVQHKQHVPLERRVTVRQLGKAEGGTVAADINRPLAILTFVGVFIAFCLLLLLASNVSQSMRDIREAEQAGTEPASPDAGR
jgi:hypothetical protein